MSSLKDAPQLDRSNIDRRVNDFLDETPTDIVVDTTFSTVKRKEHPQQQEQKFSTLTHRTVVQNCSSDLICQNTMGY